MSKRSSTTSNSLRPSLARHLDALCDEFEVAWQAGQRPVVEEYLQGQSETDRVQLLRELLAIEFAYRRQTCETPLLEEYERRFPDHRSVIESLLESKPFNEMATAYFSDGQMEDNPGGLQLPAVPGYEVLEEIGRGGMGAVLRVTDPDFERTLAVKIMLPEALEQPGAETRFLQEAKITGQLQHPGIPPAHEMGRLENGLPFFAMKLIKGETLSSLLKNRESGQEHPDPNSPHSRFPAPDPRLIGIFGQVCHTIAYAHSRGVLHRDLKPQNIMVGAFGEVQVMDWGLAKLIVKLADEPETRAITSSTIRSLQALGDRALSHTGDVMGTPAYMAPEQARGETRTLDPRADVFGLGAILCEILTGKPAFQGASTIDLVFQAINGNLDDANQRLDGCGADAELIELCKKCLAPDKNDRPRHAGAVAEAVERYEAQVQERLRRAELERAEAQVKAIEEKKRRRWIAVAAAAAMLLLAGISVFALWYQQDRARQDREETIRQVQANAEKAQREKDIRQALHNFRQSCQKLHDNLRDEKKWRTYLDKPAKWEAELNSLRSLLQPVKSLLASSKYNLNPGLQTQLQELEKQLASDQTDRQLALALEQVRLERSTISENKLNSKVALEKYPKLFRQAGLDVEKGELPEMAERIQRSPIRKQLVAALDDWAYMIWAEKNKIPRRWLEVSRLADPDPWHDRIRTPQTWAKRELEHKLMAELRQQPHMLEKLSPQMLVLVGALLPNGENRTSWLRQAQALHPNDFWLNFGLANALRKKHPHEAIGLYRAALAVRSQSVAVYYNLGGLLVDEKDAKGAILHFKKAIRLDPKLREADYILGTLLYGQKDLKGAIAHYRKALQLNPNCAKAHNNLGLVLADQKNLRGAIAYYHKALQLDPKMAKAHYNLGIALSAQRDLKGAIVHFKKTLDLDPNNVGAYNNLGLVLADQKDLTAAIAHYHEALQLDPKMANVHYNLANALSAQKDLKGAIVHFKKSLDLDPNNVGAYNNLGLALYHEQDLKGATQHFTRALQLDPNNATAYTNLGVVLADQKDLSSAIQHFKKALQLDPEYVKAYVGLGLALNHQQDLKGAIEHFKKALQLDPNNAAAYTSLGVVLGHQKDLQLAIKHLKKAIQLDPNYAEAYYNLGVALYRKKNLHGAITQLKKAIQLNPELATAHLELGNALHARKDLKGAIVHFKKALDLNPKLAAAYNNLGLVLADQKDLKGAIAHYHKALQLDPKMAMAHFNLGNALSAQKELIGAIKHYRKAVQLDPNDAKVHYNLGNALYIRNDLAGAIHHYQKALHRDSKFTRAYVGLGLALHAQRDLKSAIANHKKALQIDPNDAYAHANLGLALRDFGQFSESLASLKQALQLLPDRHPYRSLMLQNQHFCERFLALEQKLPRALKGEKTPAAELLSLAFLCRRYLNRYRDAVQLSNKAFAAEPILARNLVKQYRYFAACAAALAATAKGKNAGKLPIEERTQLRRQALTWLQADVNSYRKMLDARLLAAWEIQQRLDVWHEDADLSTIRDKDELAKLPETERVKWQQLWTDVETLRKKAHSSYRETVLKATLTNANREQVHAVQLAAGKTYIILMGSKKFDTFLRLENAKGKQLAENDDITAGKILNSRITFTPNQSGTYRLIGTSFKQRGRGQYEIIIREFRNK